MEHDDLLAAAKAPLMATGMRISLSLSISLSHTQQIPIVVSGPETHMTAICQVAIDELKQAMKGTSGSQAEHGALARYVSASVTSKGSATGPWRVQLTR